MHLQKPNKNTVMKKNILAQLLFCCCNHFAGAQSYKKLHFGSILVGTHNDIPTTAVEKGMSFDADLSTRRHSDQQRMKRDAVDVQLF